jgi:hypothetical protein
MGQRVRKAAATTILGTAGALTAVLGPAGPASAPADAGDRTPTRPGTSTATPAPQMRSAQAAESVPDSGFDGDYAVAGVLLVGALTSAALIARRETNRVLASHAATREILNQQLVAQRAQAAATAQQTRHDDTRSAWAMFGGVHFHLEIGFPEAGAPLSMRLVVQNNTPHPVHALQVSEFIFTEVDIATRQEHERGDSRPTSLDRQHVLDNPLIVEDLASGDGDESPWQPLPPRLLQDVLARFKGLGVPADVLLGGKASATGITLDIGAGLERSDVWLTGDKPSTREGTFNGVAIGPHLPPAPEQGLTKDIGSLGGPTT